MHFQDSVSKIFSQQESRSIEKCPIPDSVLIVVAKLGVGLVFLVHVYSMTNIDTHL